MAGAEDAQAERGAIWMPQQCCLGHCGNSHSISRGVTSHFMTQPGTTEDCRLFPLTQFPLLLTGNKRARPLTCRQMKLDLKGPIQCLIYSESSMLMASAGSRLHEQVLSPRIQSITDQNI